MAQTYVFGTFASSQMVGIPECVAPGLALFESSETPLLTAVSPNLDNLPEPCKNATYKYEERVHRVKRTTLNGALDNSTTTVVLANATAAAGEYIQVDEEVILLGTTSDNLTFSTCTRAQYSTSGAAHLDGAVVNLMGIPAAQGSAAGTADAVVEPNEVTTYSMILKADIGVSGTAQVLDQYWRNNGQSKYDYNLSEQGVNLKRILENNLIWSTSQASSGVSTAGRFTGIYSRLSSYLTDLSDAAFSIDDLDTALQTVMDYGTNQSGIADTLVVNQYTARVIRKWNLPYLALPPDQAAIYGERVNLLDMGGVQMKVIMNPHFGAHCALLSSKFIKVGSLRPFAHTFLGVDGDRLKGQLIGEYTCMIACPAAHRFWTSVKVS